MEEKIKATSIVKNMDKYGSSPAMLQRSVLETTRDFANGEYDIVSPQNPLAFLLEVSAQQTASMIGKNWLLTRRQYAVSAQTPEDLYYHLSDKDYIGVFSNPNITKITISFQLNDLLSMMLPMDDGSGDKLTIPKGASVLVGGINFTTEYPVDIVRLKHGSFRITYDTTEESPIYSPSSNIVEYKITTMDGLERVLIEIEMVQVKLSAIEKDITVGRNITITKTFTNQFYWARVFTGSESAGWKEMKTTHCPDVYDPLEPTAVLKVTGSTLKVSIPAIYNKVRSNANNSVSNTLGGRIKVIIYTTSGKIKMNLEAYPANAFKWQWFPEGTNKRDYTNISKFASKLQDSSSTIIFSRAMMDGGRDALEFEELRKRVINNNTGPNKIPVSDISMETKNIDNGFEVVRAVDVVSNRKWWATRSLPDPEIQQTMAVETSNQLITPASASIETIATSVSELVSSGNVFDNGKRVTISPNTIYNNINGITSIVDKREVDRIKSLPTEQRAKEVNSNNFFFTPFHYVVDTNNETTTLRPYYLDAPRANDKSYVTSNHRIDQSCTIREYNIVKGLKGYELTVVVVGNQDYKKLLEDELWAQLSYSIPHDANTAYIAGKLQGLDKDNNPVFTFFIDTTFDLNDNHDLMVNSAMIVNTEPMKLPFGLTQDVNITIGAYGALNNWSPIDMDKRIGHFALKPDAKVIVTEQISLKVGDYLKYLWTRVRPYAGEAIYKRWEEDIPMVYERDIYEEDPVTGSKVIVGKDGKLTWNITHKKGDPYLDNNGNVIYRHRKDSLVLDENGKPIVSEPRRVLRRLEIMLVDGCYWFADDPIVKGYRDELVSTFISWLTTGLEPINSQAWDQTDIMYYPRSTLGDIKVMFDDSTVTHIRATQSLTVKMTVPKVVNDNPDVIKKIKTSTVRAINEELDKRTVSVSDMISKLKDMLGADVTGIDIKGLGGSRNIVTYSAMDDSKRCTLKKKLVVGTDDVLSVEEDVTFNIMPHDTKFIKQ